MLVAAALWNVMAPSRAIVVAHVCVCVSVYVYVYVYVVMLVLSVLPCTYTVYAVCNTYGVVYVCVCVKLRYV